MKNTHKTVGKEDSKGVFKQAVLCNWQLFQTPSGYSMANSIIESYNHRIKAYFTCGLKFHMLPVVGIWCYSNWINKCPRGEHRRRQGYQMDEGLGKKAIDAKRFVLNKEGREGSKIFAIPEVKLPKKKWSMPMKKIVHVVSFLTKLCATNL